MDLKWEEPGWLRSSDLMILCSFILRRSQDDAPHIQHSLKLLSNGFKTNSLSQFTAITFIRHCILSQRLPGIIEYADRRIAHDPNPEMDNEMEWAIHILDVGRPGLSDELLSMASLAIRSALRSPDATRSWQIRQWRTRETAQCAWLSRSGVSEDVFDNVLDGLSAYHEYFESLRDGVRPSRWLLAWHTRLLMHLNRLIRSPRRALVYEHERHVDTTKFLARLFANIFSMDEGLLGWGQQHLSAFQKCKTQLQSTLILARRELQRYEYSDGASRALPPKMVLPVVTSEALGPLLDLYSAVVDGPAPLTLWIRLKSKDEFIAGLDSALETDPRITFDMINELALKLLFINSTDSHQMALPINPQDDPTAVYDILSHTQFGNRLIRVVSHRIMAGATLSDIDWWPIVWLLGDARRCVAARRQSRVEEADVKRLFLLVTVMLENDRDSWWNTCRKLMVAWFVETWVPSLTREIRTTESTWTSDETVRHFSANVYWFDYYANDGSIIQEENSSYNDNETFTWYIDINHEHTFHFIEHIVQDNPAAAITSDLERSCEDLLQTTGPRFLGLGRTIPGGDEEQDPRGTAARRARGALDSLAAFRQQSDGWSYSCQTCDSASTAGPKGKAQQPVPSAGDGDIIVEGLPK
ncbi:hypothetical protein FRB94_002437 [Tulasnella sp. JGI-2019a]|nr:hypothetical protein FRB94_002437 [Tulasnella sp. JGI-2019a]